MAPRRRSRRPSARASILAWALISALLGACADDELASADSGEDSETGETGETDTTDTSEDEAVALADAALWVEAPLAADPLADHQPDEILCLPGSWTEELGVLEVSTATCNYLSLDQPLAAALDVGDRIEIGVWWATLLAPEPAAGHLALLIDDVLVWETWVEIPAQADARQFEVTSPVAAAPGAKLSFHLHNHGQNSWTLASVERLPR